MKKLAYVFFVINSFFETSLTLKAQITLEYVLDSTVVQQFYCTDIGVNETKYISLDYPNNSFSILNMDMTSFISNINIPSISDSLIQGCVVMYVTRSLFDCDSSNIEYVFENPFDVKHAFRVFRTDGTLLFQLDSANAPYGFGVIGGSQDIRPIINTSSGTKLFLQKFDSNQVPQILVYTLCGTLPVTVYDFPAHKSFVKIYPNPTAELLNFEVTYPNNLDVFDLVIQDDKGAEQKRVNVSANKRFNLDVSNLSSGMYFYTLITKNKVYQTGKFVLKK